MCYDAQTYQEKGFIHVAGDISHLSLKPRLWQVNVTVRTTDGEKHELRTHFFKFKTHRKCRLSELSQVINRRIKTETDYLPDTLSVMVVARILM